jgi:hypothetical protein
MADRGLEWDRSVFPSALETEGDAHDCFRIFRTLFEEVTHQTIPEMFTVRTNVMFTVREQGIVTRPTFTIAVPEPARPSEGASRSKRGGPQEFSGPTAARFLADGGRGAMAGFVGRTASSGDADGWCARHTRWELDFLLDFKERLGIKQEELVKRFERSEWLPQGIVGS